MEHNTFGNAYQQVPFSFCQLQKAAVGSWRSVPVPTFAVVGFVIVPFSFQGKVLEWIRLLNPRRHQI